MRIPGPRATSRSVRASLAEAEQHLGRKGFKIAIELRKCPRRVVDPDREALPCRRGGSGMKSGRLIESRLRLLEIATIIARSCGYFATFLPAGDSTCQTAPKACKSWPFVCPGMVSRTKR